MATNDSATIKILFLALLAGSVLLAPTSVPAASLESELADFIYLHPLVKAGKSSVQSAEQGVRQSNAGYLPLLQASLAAGPEHIDNPTTRAGDKDWQRTMQTGGLTLTQNIFNG